MSEFVFKEIDLEGLETLKAISAANKFNDWMYDQVAAEASGKILEIGSGIGNISERFIKAGNEIYLTDIRDNYLEYLEKNFSDKASGILKLDIVDPDFEKNFSELLGQFDLVFALNVVEHIKDDQLAIDNIKKLLKPGGKIFILVPAYQALYNNFDEALEHYRRYNKKSLNKLYEKAGLEILNSYYFNLAGIAGWFFTGKILGKKVIPSGQMKLYNSLVPIFKIVDRVFLRSMGLSVISVAKKKN